MDASACRDAFIQTTNKEAPLHNKYWCSFIFKQQPLDIFRNFTIFFPLYKKMHLEKLKGH